MLRMHEMVSSFSAFLFVFLTCAIYLLTCNLLDFTRYIIIRTPSLLFSLFLLINSDFKSVRNYRYTYICMYIYIFIYILCLVNPTKKK